MDGEFSALCRKFFASCGSSFHMILLPRLALAKGFCALWAYRWYVGDGIGRFVHIRAFVLHARAAQQGADSRKHGAILVQKFFGK